MNDIRFERDSKFLGYASFSTSETTEEKKLVSATTLLLRV